MTDLSSTLARLRSKAARAHLLKRDSFKPAFLEAMEVIEQQQAEIERLLQAVADGGLRAGELTGKLVDAEKALGWYADRRNYDYEGRVITNGDAPRRYLHICDFGSKARKALAGSYQNNVSKEDI